MSDQPSIFKNPRPHNTSAGTLTYFYPVRSRGEPVQLCIAYGLSLIHI